ncbi:MAG: methylated-DNA--[protein]-cysteine S-methyltransferase [Syntrophobacterales bacterium]|nr:methylated-DNA--[protein]-cysteine S-methyltransferase [Syntrophobacterales bacterium]
MFCKKTFYYRLIASIFGNVGIVWVREEESPLIIRAVFPRNGMSTTDMIRKDFPDAEEGLHKNLEKTCGSISAFLGGACVNFSMKFVGIDRCGDFQRRVLLETMRIPRGSVTSYGSLAKRVSASGAARAVGSALAGNPFPIIIPCHRVVRSDGYVGQFGGGTEAKKALLSMEGVEIDNRGKIVSQGININPCPLL